MRVLNYINSTIWAMLPVEYDKMHAVVTSRSAEIERALIDSANSQFLRKPGEKLKITSDVSINPQNMLARRGERLSGTRYVQVRDGVAIIDINGVIAMRMNMFEELCEGGTSTEILARDFQFCLDAPDVKSIVLLIHSPGGEAFGTNEFAQMVFAARGRKPIKAYISGYGCSAAYFIAAACDEIICDAQAMLGSIGVVSEWQDATQLYKNLGIDRRVVTSSNAPKKRLNLNKPEDEAEFVATLDAMENVFIKFVGKARGKTVEQIKTDFNSGGVLIGKDAVKVGMADRTGSLEGVISELQKKPRKSNLSATSETAPKTNLQKEKDMSIREKIREFFNSEEIKLALEDETETPASATETNQPPAVAEQPAAAPASVEPPAPVPPVEKPDAATLEQQFAKFREEAGAFAASEIKAGRMSPREKDDFVEDFVQSALDDTVSPLASGSTRVERLKARSANRKPSLLTEETVNAETNQILLAQTGASGTDEKKQRLLSSTQLGKRTLQLVKK